MVTLTFYFYTFLTIFAIIGLMRGWAKELLVTFSVILAVFIIFILESLLPSFLVSLNDAGFKAYFWFRSAILVTLVFFGYQTPNLSKIAGARFARERLADSLLGLVLGAINGYLIVGTLWFFMNAAMYPFPSVMRPPDANDPFTRGALEIIQWLPPTWLTGTPLYVVVALAFAFVIVVLI